MKINQKHIPGTHEQLCYLKKTVAASQQPYKAMATRPAKWLYFRTQCSHPTGDTGLFSATHKTRKMPAWCLLAFDGRLYSEHTVILLGGPFIGLKKVSLAAASHSRPRSK